MRAAAARRRRRAAGPEQREREPEQIGRAGIFDQRRTPPATRRGSPTGRAPRPGYGRARRRRRRARRSTPSRRAAARGAGDDEGHVRARHDVEREPGDDEGSGRPARPAAARSRRSRSIAAMPYAVLAGSGRRLSVLELVSRVGRMVARGGRVRRLLGRLERIELAFPARDHHARHRIADDVGRRAAHVEEMVDRRGSAAGPPRECRSGPASRRSPPGWRAARRRCPST